MLFQRRYSDYLLPNEAKSAILAYPNRKGLQSDALATSIPNSTRPLDKTEALWYNKIASDNLSDLCWRFGEDVASFLFLDLGFGKFETAGRSLCGFPRSVDVTIASKVRIFISTSAIHRANTQVLFKTMSKIIRDPLHDLIRVECKYALRLIDSEPMQRLRKIRQLGLAWLVFPGAEHSRFVHSLGVFHLANQAMGYLNRIKRPGSDDLFFNEHQQTVIGLAALAHDFGHGPFSHVFERVARDALGSAASTHVEWTIKILQEHPQVSKIMQDAGSGAANTVREILSGTHELHYMNDIISSQLVLQRDFTLVD